MRNRDDRDHRQHHDGEELWGRQEERERWRLRDEDWRLRDEEGRKKRLQGLDLSFGLFEKAFELALADVRTCTDLDAPPMRGVMMWSRVNRYLAEDEDLRKWGRSSKDSIMRVIHPSGSHAVTAMSGEGGVGNLARSVRSKNPKGPAVARVVERTGQLALLSRDEVLFGEEIDDIPTWFLLYKRENGTLYSELSLPLKMEGKYISQWQERIPLPDLNDPEADVSPLDQPVDLTGPDVLVEFMDR